MDALYVGTWPFLWWHLCQTWHKEKVKHACQITHEARRKVVKTQGNNSHSRLFWLFLTSGSGPKTFAYSFMSKSPNLPFTIKNKHTIKQMGLIAWRHSDFITLAILASTIRRHQSLLWAPEKKTDSLLRNNYWEQRVNITMATRRSVRPIASPESIIS